MRIECPAKALLAAVRQCLPAVPPRTTKPILSCVRIVADGSGVSVSATDFEVAIRTTAAGCVVIEPGIVIAPADRLAAILSEAGTSTITLEWDDEETSTLKYQKSRYSLPTYPPAEYPELPKFGAEESHYQVAPAVLADLIGKTTYAAAKLDADRKFTLHGLRMELDGTDVRMVATDTRKLALARGPATPVADPAPAAQIVPPKAVKLLSQSIDAEDSEPVRITLRKNEAVFIARGAAIFSQLIDGRFPPYDKIIPKKHAASVSLPVGDFLARVRQAAVMSDVESKRIDCQFEDGKLTLTARGAETGSSEVEMPLPGYAGESVDIALVADNLVEMLRAVGNDATLTLELTDGNKPAVFRSGDDFVYLVMPLAG